MQQSYDRIRALHEIDTAIGSTLDLVTALNLLLEKSAVFLPNAVAGYARLFERESTPETVACYKLDAEDWKARVKLEPGHASALRAGSGPVTVRNLQTSPWTMNREFFRSHGLVSQLEVPLTAEGQCVGVLGFYTKWEHEFTGEEIDFAATLAGQAAIAIQNARLFEQIKLAKTKAEFSNQVLDKTLRQLSSL